MNPRAKKVDPALADCGEDAVVRSLTRRLARDPLVREGPGDDCAVIGPPGAAEWQLLKTDMVVEGVHFRAGESASKVGWKALCRAISDIGAMGGTPRHALITVGAPPDLPLRWLRGVYAGLARAGRAYGVSIVGGETGRMPGGLFLSVALTGIVRAKRCVLRSGGRPGDRLFVTGRLGGSLASGRHLSFRPRLREAQWLAATFPPSAMMDLSDGLAGDLPRLAAASGCGWSLDEARLPKAKGCTIQQALCDGEDYELLLALPPAAADRVRPLWKAKFPRLPLTEVGELTPLAASRPIKLHGYDHFAKRR